MVCVLCTKNRHLAAKCTPRCLRPSGDLVHNKREDKVRRRAPLERNQGVLGPSPHGGRHIFIRGRALFVGPR
jgi:hypothetical protein